MDGDEEPNMLEGGIMAQQTTVAAKDTADTAKEAHAIDPRR